MNNNLKLRIQKLSKSYKGRDGCVSALNNVSLDVDEGEFVCVVGQSGCGKTTLLNLIAGFDKPDNGSVETFNIHKPENPHEIVIFQEPSLYPWLTVTGNVELGLRLTRMPKRERKERIDKYLSLVGLSEFSNAYIHQLSGGMKQRIVLARALALEPELLLMDEPFAALDVQTRRNLHIELLRIVSETKMTVLFITHNIEEALFLGDRVIVMTPHPGTVKEIFSINTPKPRRFEDSAINGLSEKLHRSLGLGGVNNEEVG